MFGIRNTKTPQGVFSEVTVTTNYAARRALAKPGVLVLPLPSKKHNGVASLKKQGQ